MYLISFFIRHCLIKIIEFIEFIEYWDIVFDEDNIFHKIIKSIPIVNQFAFSDKGFVPISRIHKTQPFKIWELVTLSGKTIYCADNHILFNQNFDLKLVRYLRSGDIIKVQEGSNLIDDPILYIRRLPYKISMMDLTIDTPDHRFFTNGILSHNTTTSSIFISWYTCFNIEKSILFTANKGDTAKEIIKKAKEIIYRLPFFIKPGLITNNVQSMYFDNGCTLRSDTTTEKSSIGFTVHLLFMDEFAHVEPGIQSSFYENIMPTLTAPGNNGRCIITSTPNGFNLFKDIWDTSLMDNKLGSPGPNGFSPFRIDWWEAPGRDEKWKEEQILKLGGEEAFERQFGNSFVSHSVSLLDGQTIRSLYKDVQDFQWKPVQLLEDSGIPYSRLFWHPDENPEDHYKSETNFYYISFDLSEGGGKDYQVFQLFLLEPKPKDEWERIQKSNQQIYDFFRIRQIAMYRFNSISLSDFANLSYEFVLNFLNMENCKMLVEYNTYGSEFIYRLTQQNGTNNRFDEEIIMRFKHTKEARENKKGLKVRKDNKPIIANDWKDEIEKGRIKIQEFHTIEEISQFGRNRKGTYSGLGKHDDAAMACINLGSIFKSYYFSDLVDEIISQDETLYEDINSFMEGNERDWIDVNALDFIGTSFNDNSDLLNILI